MLASSILSIILFSFDSLDDLGRPSPIVMVRVFPPGLSWARSPWPLWKATTLAPPPPQPSFFTLNSSLRPKKSVGGLWVWEHQCKHNVSEREYKCVVLSPVSEGDCQFSLGHLLVAFREQAEELGLEVGLQQAVVLRLVQDEKVVLPRAAEKQTSIYSRVSLWGSGCLWVLDRCHALTVQQSNNQFSLQLCDFPSLINQREKF